MGLRDGIFLVGLDRFLGCYVFVLGKLLYVKWLSCCHKSQDSQVISPQLMEPQTEQIQKPSLKLGHRITRMWIL